MNNIVLFCERRFAAKFSASNTFVISAGSRSAERAVPSQRPRLIATWHINSLTGKLECFWTTEGEPGRRSKSIAPACASRRRNSIFMSVFDAHVART